MKRPNLEYNYYFPFYTQQRKGKKTGLHWSITYMHLSDNKAIRIYIEQLKNGIRQIGIEMVDSSQALYKCKLENKHITYLDFAGKVKEFYHVLYRTLRMLSNEPVYRKQLVFSSLVKFNQNIELEIDWKKINIDFRTTDYRIEHGKIVRLKESPFANSDSEAGKKWYAIGKAFDESTNYRIVENDVLEDRLNDCWESFRELFEAPKFLRKKEYIL